MYWKAFPVIGKAFGGDLRNFTNMLQIYNGFVHFLNNVRSFFNELFFPQPLQQIYTRYTFYCGGYNNYCTIILPYYSTDMLISHFYITWIIRVIPIIIITLMSNTASYFL